MSARGSHAVLGSLKESNMTKFMPFLKTRLSDLRDSLSNLRTKLASLRDVLLEFFCEHSVLPSR